MTKHSRDYEKLFELICGGFVVAGFVDYSFMDSNHVSRDVCKIERIKEFQIVFGVRGMSYGDIYDFDCMHGTEKDVFIKNCESLNLEWVESLSVAPASAIRQRFNIGLIFILKRPSYEREYEIIDIYKTYNCKNELIKIRYVCKSALSTDYDMVDTTIARAIKT